MKKNYREINYKEVIREEARKDFLNNILKTIPEELFLNEDLKELKINTGIIEKRTGEKLKIIIPKEDIINFINNNTDNHDKKNNI